MVGQVPDLPSAIQVGQVPDLSALTLLLFSQVRLAAGQNKRDQIEELLEVTHINLLQDQFIRQMAARNNPAVPP